MKRKPLLAGSAALICLLIGGFFYSRSLPDELEKSAMHGATAILDGDLDTLYGMSSSMERETGLTEAQLKQIYEISVRPRLRFIRERKGERVIVSLKGGDVTGLSDTILTNGREHYTSLHAYAGDTQAQTTVVGSMLDAAWMLEYFSQPGVPEREPGDGMKAVLAGIRADRSKLEAIGVRGMFLGTSVGFKSWDAIDAQIREAIPKVIPNRP